MLLFKHCIVVLFVLIVNSSLRSNRNRAELKTYSAFQKNLHVDIVGMVTIDGKPAFANIEIVSVYKNHFAAEKISTDTKTGLFKIAIKTDDEYDLIVKVKQLPQQILVINSKQIDSTKTINVFADFTTAAYDHKLEELKKSIEEKIKSDLNASAFEKKYGKLKKEMLVYKIQVGAFKFYENFNYSNVIDLPKIIRKTDSDFITRFTIGSYNTYGEALKMLKQVNACGLNEAFIIAYYKEERKLLSQLLVEKIIP